MDRATWQDSIPPQFSTDVREHTERVEAWAFTRVTAAATQPDKHATRPPPSEPPWTRLDPYAVGAAAVGATLIALAVLGW